MPEFTDEMFFGKDINSMNDPFIYLREALLEKGYELKTSENNSLDNCEWVLFMNSKSNNQIAGGKWNLKNNIKKLLGIQDPSKKFRNLYQECAEKNFKNIALFLWEPEAVNPVSYAKDYLDKFKIVFTWNDDLVDNKKFFKFFLPYPRKKPYEKLVPFSEKKLLTNITANKISKVKNELYSERRKSIEYFDKHYPNDFDLYGVRWNKPSTLLENIFPQLTKKFQCFKGHAADKLETFSRYKFALCYENMSGLKGFVTEKIFDCMLAGCVPVYWGAENIEKYIDADVYVDRRKFKDNQELADFLFGISEEKYGKHLSAIGNFILGDKYRMFLPDNFSKIIINTLKL